MKKVSIPPLVDRLTPEQTRALVFNDNVEAQEWFARVFSKDIRETVAGLTKVFNSYRELETTVVVDHRRATVMLFVHTAFNSLLTSVHLLVSGYPVPAGQLMRHYAECAAMALLCADDSLNVYDQYVKNRKEYPVQKSLHRIMQKDVSKSLQKKFGLDPVGYAKFVAVIKFYDKHSHASALTLSYSLMFTEAGGLVIGSQIDPSKRKQYQSEIRHCKRACNVVLDLIEILDAGLPKRTAKR